MRIFRWVRQLFGTKSGDPADDLACLLLAARQDETFQRQLLALLRAPDLQRQSIVNTALHEMELRGEPRSMRAAFATLATEEGARHALAILAGAG